MRVTVVSVLLLLAAGCGRTTQPAPPPQEATAPAGASSTATVTGTVAAGSDGLAAIVLLEPKKPAASNQVAAPAEPKVMDQFGQAFVPTLLVASKGQPVEFRNSEDTLHNIRVFHVETKEPAFNISLPQTGKYTFAFEREGFYAVSCDIHPAMAADILVTSTPFSDVADADGRFTIHDVPSGQYSLVVLRGGQRTAREVTVAGPKTDLTAPAAK